MKNYYIPLQPGGLYHICNRATGSERLFIEPDNYRFFLNKFRLHCTPVAETLAWCLIPNHYHFLVRIRPEKEIQSYFVYKKRKELKHAGELPDFLMERFSNFQNSYAKAFNKVYSRKGSLFMDYARRVAIDSDRHLTTVVLYIHNNPVQHHCCKSMQDWAWSSYNEYRKGRFRHVNSRELRPLFSSPGSFQEFHQPELAVS